MKSVYRLIPVHLRAISVGYAVPRVDFDAVVHSVFRSAANLRPSNSNRLLTLLASNQPDLPQGIRLDAPEEFSFEVFRTGEQVTCRDGILRSDSLTIELRDARRWKCDLSALEADSAKPTVSAAWSFVWDALNQRQRLSGVEIIADDLFRPGGIGRSGLSRKTGEALQELVASTQRYALTDSSAVRALIGLGSGLTPSGDDLLVGYLAGLWSTVRGKNDRAQFLAGLGKTIIRHSRQTNDISRAYLYHATRGQVSSRLADLSEAISRGEKPERLRESAEAAMQLGHSSGMDAVTGLLVGLTTWISPEIPCFYCRSLYFATTREISPQGHPSIPG